VGGIDPIVVDDLVSAAPWTPRFLRIRARSVPADHPEVSWSGIGTRRTVHQPDRQRSRGQHDVRWLAAAVARLKRVGETGPAEAMRSPLPGHVG
jgi:hypothetical protein